jgi:ribose/xylose/arabinose/galactoside ABC-type transport system permease subunit
MSDIAAHPQIVRHSPIIGSVLRAPGAFYLLLIMGVMLAFWTPGFFTAANLTNVALQVAVLTIVHDLDHPD